MAALGKTLKLDVGEAEEESRAPDGRVFKTRDNVGLSLDPKKYAKLRCRTCHGNGILLTSKPLSQEAATAMIKHDAANGALIHHNTKAKDGVIKLTGNYTRSTSVCGCVPKRFERARRKLLELVEGEFQRLLIEDVEEAREVQA